MSDFEDLASDEPPVIDPYEVLGLERTATADQVKVAYRKTALRCHPDKVSEDKKADAHVQFQNVAFAYAVLSDPGRRQRYDTTGSTAESVVDEDGFSWSDFYRAAFADAVSGSTIDEFAKTYRGSDEERADVLAAYTRAKGNMDSVYEIVMLSRVIEDDARFRAIIDAAIAAGDVRSFPAYANETNQARAARAAAARHESREAEEYAKELGVHDKLFGDGKDKGAAGGRGGRFGKAKGKKDDQAGLAALIQKRQQDRAATFLDDLAVKYGAAVSKGRGKKGKKGKKRPADDESEEDTGEPSEEAFQAAAARLKDNQAQAQAQAPKRSRKKRARRN